MEKQKIYIGSDESLKKTIDLAKKIAERVAIIYERSKSEKDFEYLQECLRRLEELKNSIPEKDLHKDKAA